MQLLGKEYIPSNELLHMCGRYVSAVYGYNRANVNAVRYAKGADSTLLPPTRDALHQHILRANYQAAVWVRCLKQFQERPSPHGHGWISEESTLKINWMVQSAAPKDILQTVSCKCQSGCASNRCCCRRSGLQCTDICGCQSCENYNKGRHDSYLYYSEDESDEAGDEQETSLTV